MRENGQRLRYSAQTGNRENDRKDGLIRFSCLVFAFPEDFCALLLACSSAQQNTFFHTWQNIEKSAKTIDIYCNK